MVEVVDVTNNSITIIGISIVVNSSTIFKDESDQEIQAFNIANINVGDYLEVKAFDQGQGITAAQLVRKIPEDELTLEGPVSAVDAVLFTLNALGTTVITDQFTEFKDANEATVTQAQFFALVSIDDLVEVKWDAALEITAPAKEIELEGDD